VKRIALAPLVVLLGVTACTGEPAQSDTPSLSWEAVDDLNGTVPAGIHVYRGRNDNLPLRAWYVHIDQAAPHIRTQVVVSDDESDNRETVSSFSNDLDACVVVNGGYFRMDQTPAGHVGLLMSQGQVLWPATRSVLRDSVSYETARGAIGFNAEGEIQITWVTTREGAVYSWPVPPAHRPGTPAEPLRYDNAATWDVVSALSAGPVLVVDGKMQVTSDQEVFFGTSIPDVHPRTAAGRTRDGALIVMVVDGRQMLSRGVSLEELATLMLEVGAVDALNLDGGGSSTLVVNGVLLNRPTGGAIQREVMSAIATFCDE
jgi:exopolysaccharide biosynthesis protein